MRRQALAVLGLLVGMLAPSGATAMIDPITREPLVKQSPQVRQDPQTYSRRRSGAAIAREVVSYPGREAPGTVVIDTEERRLYFVLGNGQAVRYGIGVGRPGFQWGGKLHISQKREWPDWRPPAQMIKRQPYLPRWMPGGPNNPLGARAIYLGSSLYRIHGSNEPHTIGQEVSSGCFRMTNEDVIDLYERVKIGAKVTVLR